jgi:Pyridine nucleotide-disulphide oxidoreductase
MIKKEKNTMQHPSIATLKCGEEIMNDFLPLTNALANWRIDKCYAPQVLEYWLRKQQHDQSHALETLIGRFLMRLPYDATSQRLYQAIGASLYGEPRATYTGTPQENALIDQAVATSNDHSGYRDRILHGATRFFSLEGFRVPSWAGTQTRIVILGSGAAGILAARTLLNAGYRNILILSETNAYGGIWREANVQFSRNNPFPFTYENFRVEAAPGSGLAITAFLDHLVTPLAHTQMRPLPDILRGQIVRVVPGDLNHLVMYRDEHGYAQTLAAPIVINALGLGKPLPLSRPGVIETDVAEVLGGFRWQQHLTQEDAEQLRGKRVVFIGLGNSTIEMVVQLQKLNTLGYNISYKVLTHHSQEAVRYPTFPDQQGYQLYRNVVTPHLTRLAGDLPYVDAAFRQLRGSEDTDLEEVIADVSHWTIEQEGGEHSMVLQTRGGRQRGQRFPFHRLYTLIGYGYTPEQISDMGLARTAETVRMQIAHDCDGEFQKQGGFVGRERLYPGYFGLSALLSAPNAIVIPGMLYRLPDLLVGVTLRTTEALLRSKGYDF